MARQNRRSGDIDFLSIAEGGSGAASLEAFRQQHEFVALDDPRIIKVMAGAGSAPELKIDSVADLSVFRPELIGPSSINIGETAQFLIANRDLSVTYSAQSEHGVVRVEEGLVYFTLTNNSSTLSNAVFSVNGFNYSLAIVNTGPVAGTALVSAVKNSTSTILAISATEYKSNDGSVYGGIEYQVSLDYDFEQLVNNGKSSINSVNVTVDLVDTLYIRMRYISSTGVNGQWFYSDPVIASEIKSSIAKPYGVGALTTDNETYTLLIKGSKFLSASGLTLKAIEVEEYSDSELLSMQNSSMVSTTVEEFSSAYTPASSYAYIRFRYKDTGNNLSEWSNVIRLSASGAYNENPIAEYQKISEPLPYQRGEFGYNTRISEDGKILVATSHSNNIHGAVYIFKRINDKWTFHQYLGYPDATGASNALFGTQIQISSDGGLVFIAARAAMADLSGAVYVYRYDSTVDQWVRRDTILNHDKIVDKSFGSAIHISADGSKLIIADNFRYNIYSGKTRVDPRLYFYSYVGTEWILDQTLSFAGSWNSVNDRGFFASAGAANITFDRFVFTAPRHNSENGIMWNLAKVNGIWTIVNSLTHSKGFGDSLVANADLSEVIVGGGQNNGTNTGAGFLRFLSYDSATSTYIVTSPIVSPAQTGTGFGYKIARNSAGNLLLVTARLINSSTGEVYLYKKFGSEWIRINVYAASDKKTGEEFGSGAWFDEANNEIIINANAWGSQGVGSLYLFKPEAVEYTDLYVNNTNEYEIINDYILPAGSNFGAISRAIDNNETILVRISANPDTNLADGSHYIAQLQKRNGVWVKTAVITRPQAFTAAGFGTKIEHCQLTDMLAISQASNSAVDAGAVHIYKRDASGTWQLLQSLTSQTDPTGNAYGFDQALSGDGTTLVVGQIRGNNAELGTSGGRGCLHVYKLENSIWVFKQLITSDFATATSVGLGSSVDITYDGSRIAAGAWNYSNPSLGIYGLSYVFVRNLDGQYVQESRLLPSNVTAKNDLGRYIRISAAGDRIFAAARNDNEFGTGSGAVYVYRRDGTTWVLEQKLTAPVPLPGDSLPSEFEISEAGDMVVSGSRTRDSSRGEVWFHKRNGTSWSVVRTFKPNDLKAGDSLGTSIYGSKDLSTVYLTVLVGDTAYGSGQVYIVKN